MRKLFHTSLFIFLVVSPVMLRGEYDVWNSLLGLELINQEGVWYRKDFENSLFKKYNLRFHGDDSMRTLKLGKVLILNSPALEMRAHYDRSAKLALLDIIYANKGDSANEERFKNIIRNAARTISDTLSSWGGAPVRCSYGHKKMRHSARKWVGKNVEFYLEYVREEYTILHIHFVKVYQAVESKPPAGSSPLKHAGFRDYSVKGKDFTRNLKRNNFGDVYIDNIPMVDQGSKGYCVPATIERVLRYYGINNVNMHQIADAAKTKDGGGTYAKSAMRAMGSVRKSAGLKTSVLGDIRMKLVMRYIDEGVPLFWVMYTNQEYEKVRRNSLKDRLRTDPEKWRKIISKYKVPAKGGAHMCLVVGYNVLTGEVAVSNSWGDHELVPTWVPVKVASRVSQGKMFALEPR